MAENDGFDKFFEEENDSENPFFKNGKESPDETQDSDEEIIELTDPDDTPVTEPEEEVIEPADFLDELSMEGPSLDDQKDPDTSSPASDDDIIELTDTAEEPPINGQTSPGAHSLDEDLPEDKDLFVFTDSEDEAIIEDDDILSDTVFADAPSMEPELQDQPAEAEPDLLDQEEQKPEAQEVRMFDDTVFADESADEDNELAVLTEIDESSSQTEKGMFDDTILSGETMGEGDEELAVLAEPQGEMIDSDTPLDTSAGFEAPPANNDSDMILLDDTDAETPGSEEPFIESDILDSRKSEQLEMQNAIDEDIADSLGMNLEIDLVQPEDPDQGTPLEMTIEPEGMTGEPEPRFSEIPDSGGAGFQVDQTIQAVPIEPEPVIPPQPEQLEPEIPDVGHETFRVDPAMQADSTEPAPFIPSDQLDVALEKVIRKMFGDKIDSMIIDIIEKTVQADIDKIKKELLKGNIDDL